MTETRRRGPCPSQDREIRTVGKPVLQKGLLQGKLDVTQSPLRKRRDVAPPRPTGTAVLAALW